jgi:hypothetical protein
VAGLLGTHWVGKSDIAAVENEAAPGAASLAFANNWHGMVPFVHSIIKNAPGIDAVVAALDAGATAMSAATTATTAAVPALGAA